MSGHHYTSRPGMGMSLYCAHWIRAGANTNSRGSHGWAALHYVARSGHLDAMKVLLDAGADVYALDNDQRTAAQEALTYGHQEVLLRMFNKSAGA